MSEKSRAIRASLSLVEISACLGAPRSCGIPDDFEFVGLPELSSGMGERGLWVTSGPVATAPGSDRLTVATARPSPQPRGSGMILPGLHKPEGSKAARTCNIAEKSSSLNIKDR